MFYYIFYNMKIISAWWFRMNSKFIGKKSKRQSESLEEGNS